MPTKNSRRSRRPQATRQTLLTFEQAHPPVEQAVAALHAEWKKRRDERLQPFKANLTLQRILRFTGMLRMPNSQRKKILSRRRKRF